MKDPLITLLELNAITIACNEIQDWIYYARATHPTDQLFQLQLDRKQTEIDNKRELVEAIKINISQRN